MARRPTALDLLLALALGIEMQVELLFADGTRRDVWIARGALLACAAALAVRRRVPVLTAAVVIAALTLLERLDATIDENLIGSFFVVLIATYSVGAHAEGREFVAGVVVLVVGTVIAIRFDRPPGGAEDYLFGATIIVGGP